VLHADLQACHGYAAPPESLAALAMPTLVLGGSRDQMTPWRAGEALAKQVPGARFERIDAGHSMMSEAPAATLAALRRFLR
jgi:pimeloyl-ACP methyl ester carboxylesterase